MAFVFVPGAFGLVVGGLAGGFVVVCAERIANAAMQVAITPKNFICFIYNSLL
jgi:hypothetical protein